MSRSIDFKDVRIFITDGDDHSVEVVVGDGNLTYSEKRNIEYRLDRGRLDDVVEGDEVPVDVTLSFRWDYIKSLGTSYTVADIIKGKLQATGSNVFTSTDSDTCRPYACDIRFFNKPNCGSTASGAQNIENYLLADFRYESFDADIKSKEIKVTGKCNVTEVAVTRSSTVSTP